MSTIEPNTQSFIVSPELKSRILEIMEEKGKAFTTQALANRIGVNYETLRKKLRGERELHMFELRRIAEAFHMSLDRLLQLDTRDDEKKLKGMFDSLVNFNSSSKSLPDFDEILKIAQRLVELAVGATERCITLNDLGRAYNNLQRYEEAHKAFLESLKYAKIIDKKSNNKKYQSLVLSNLLVVLTLISTNIESYELLDEIEELFMDNPHRLGIVYYVRTKVAEFNKNMDLAKIHAQKSLEYFIQTENELSIGRAEATLAHYEFLTHNYVAAKKLLESAIKNQITHRRNWLISIKDYAKTLLKLHDNQKMERVVEDALSQIDQHSSKLRDIVGKLKILLSLSMNETKHAESVLYDSLMNVEVRTLAYKYLKRYCVQNGDKDTLMQYAIIEDDLETNKKDLLDEELLS